MPIMATRFLRGAGSSIGPVILDCEVSTDLTIGVTFSERRMPDKSLTSDHSQNEPDDLTITGVVDSINPLLGLGAVSYLTGQFVQHERLAALVRARDEILIVCARGRFRVTARRYSIRDDARTGFSSQFTLSCRTVQRGTVKYRQVPTDASAAMNGTGDAASLGGTNTTGVTFSNTEQDIADGLTGGA